MSHHAHRPSRHHHVTDRDFGRRVPIADQPLSAPLLASQGHVAIVWPRGSRIHTFRASRGMVYGLAGLGVAALMWTVASASYLLFKDDVLFRLTQQSREVHLAYEDRINELRGQMDRMTSRQLVDQDGVERKLESLARRQVILETRQSVVTSLGEALSTGAVARPGAPPSLFGMETPAPRIEPGVRTQRQSSLPDTMGAISLAEIKAKARRNIESAVSRLENSIIRAENEQNQSIDALEKVADERVRGLRNVFADLGVAPPKTIVPLKPLLASGGPLVPLTGKEPVEPAFETRAYRIQASAMQMERLKEALGSLPVRRPVPGDADLTSGFGARIDPFLKTWAMHTGLDFRADTGDPVRSTASGTVIEASYNGGYGNMVEVDHGNGLSTRYAHLSRIDVANGAKVMAGQVIGRAGSTGRSTGPHVHYEVRVDGDAVDPAKFLRAGSRIARLME